jgi:hypothetical protein
MHRLRIACLTYYKFPKQDWLESEFSDQAVSVPHGERIRMKLAERGAWLGGKLWVREVRKLTENGHQVSILTTNFRNSIPARLLLRNLSSLGSNDQTTYAAYYAVARVRIVALKPHLRYNNHMIPKDLYPLFWDTDPAGFDPTAYPDYAIFRVLEYGDVAAFAWLRETFADGEIRRVLCAEHRLSPKSATFWALVFGIPEGEIAALREQPSSVITGHA